MIKEIDIHGQRVKLYSPDNGRTWSSSPQAIGTYGHRKKTLTLELQKSFERIDARQDREPNQFRGFESSKSLRKAKMKNS